MDKSTVLEVLNKYQYYSIKDLRFNNELGYLFSQSQLDEFLYTKDELIDDDNDIFVDLPLKSFNSKHIFFTCGQYLKSMMKDYVSIVNDYMLENNQSLISRNIEDIIYSRIFSEIEGTLRIENVPTTHKRIKEIYKNKAINNSNDIIVMNMIKAMKFIVNDKPAFNKENLKKLYDILSANCLDENDKIPDGRYYRDDAVYVEGFDGAPCDKIDEMMNSLFDFVNNTGKNHIFYSLLPHICHYYMIYVHPYFDYNGRTARMVSFWLSIILDIDDAPNFISEAINEHKGDYYQAIRNTRITNNDLTYFLGYIMETSIKFSLIYKNLEYIEQLLSQSGEFLGKQEKMNLKKIMLHNANDYFNYRMFNEYIDNDLSKQRSLKILNDMASENLLVKKINKKKEAAYKINPELLKYEI